MDAQTCSNTIPHCVRCVAKFINIDEAGNGHHSIGGNSVVSLLVVASRFRIRDDEIVHAPVRLEMAGVSGRHAWHTCYRLQKHAKKMGSTHVRVDDIKLLVSNPFGHA